MRDVIYVAIVIGFFGLAAAYVSACARIVGGTQGAEARLSDGGDARDDDAPAPALAVVAGADAPGAAR